MLMSLMAEPGLSGGAASTGSSLMIRPDADLEGREQVRPATEIPLYSAEAGQSE
jgi:hypothetical protein